MARKITFNQFIGSLFFLIFFIIYNYLFLFINLPFLVSLILGEPIIFVLSFWSAGAFLKKAGIWKY
jgi:hypothetical protein